MGLLPTDVVLIARGATHYKATVADVLALAGGRFATNVGDGSTLTFNIDHNLGTEDVHVTARVNSSTPAERLNVLVDWYPASATRVVVTVRAGSAPAVNGLRVLVTG